MSKFVIGYTNEFQNMYFKKDVFLMPYYISKELGLSLKYYWGCNNGAEDIPLEYRFVNIEGFHGKREMISKFQILCDLLRILLIHRKQIHTLFLVHLSLPIIIITLLFKWYNPKGHIVIMGDMEENVAADLASHEFVYSQGIKGIVKKWMINSFFCKVDLFTVETISVEQILRNLFDRKGWKCLNRCHPCLDKETFDNLGLGEISYKEKENLIISVGRFGSYQKNTDMMLDAFEKIDLKNWKVRLIGPITDSFATNTVSKYTERIEAFYKKRPDLRKKVEFTGIIHNSKFIYENYLCAKVFLLTSRHEGFANVLSDAAALGCFIVSTDVGGAKEVSNNWKFGIELNQEDSSGLAKVLQNIVDGKLVPNPKDRCSLNKLEWSAMVRNNVLPYLA